MFSQKDFIAASRKFVCVRLESYESEAHQALVRSFLNGRFENTAFCLLAPDGETRLTRSSRGPSQVLGATGRGPGSTQGSAEEVIKTMNDIASSYRPKGVAEATMLQDFHSFRQALNVASGDQRLLLFVAAAESEQAAIRKRLQPLFADEDIVGRFHLDFGSAKTDAAWADSVEGTRGKSGFVIIRANQFGQEGKVMKQVPLTTSAGALKTELVAANQIFAASEERKSYSDHVSAGRRSGVFFESGMPYGEDRDGDGEIDHAPGRGGKGGGSKGGKGNKGR